MRGAEFPGFCVVSSPDRVVGLFERFHAIEQLQDRLLDPFQRGSCLLLLPLRGDELLDQLVQLAKPVCP